MLAASAGCPPPKVKVCPPKEGPDATAPPNWKGEGEGVADDVGGAPNTKAELLLSLPGAANAPSASVIWAPNIDVELVEEDEAPNWKEGAAGVAGKVKGADDVAGNTGDVEGAAEEPNEKEDCAFTEKGLEGGVAEDPNVNNWPAALLD